MEKDLVTQSGLLFFII